MPFDYKKFQRWSQSDVQGGNTLWGYATATDTIAEVLASGFFNTVNINPDPVLNIGDLIWVRSSDSTEFIEISAITPNVTSALYWPGDDEGADKALSNLAAVAVNASLVPGLDSAIDLGSNAKRWATLYADTAVLTNPLQHEYGGLEADVSSYDGVPLIQSGATSNLKMKLNATVAPAVTDDSASGYAVGSTWIDVTADDGYICLDASVGAAVWGPLGGGDTSFYIPADASNVSKLRLYENTASGSNYVSLQLTNSPLAVNPEVYIPVTNSTSYLSSATGASTSAVSHYNYLPNTAALTSAGGINLAGSVVFPQSILSNWYVGPSCGFARGAGFLTTNSTIYAILFYFPVGNYDNLIFNVTATDALARIEAAIYQPNVITTPASVVASKVIDCGSSGALSTTGEKTLSFASTTLVGWNYVCLRAYNGVGSLEISLTDGARNAFTSISSTTTGTETAGYTFTGQASLPAALNFTSPTAILSPTTIPHALVQKV